MTDAPPITLEVDERVGYDRRSIILRPVLILPAYFLLALFVAPWIPPVETPLDVALLVVLGVAPGFLTALGLATAAMITVRRRYPRWWFEAHAELIRYATRVAAYSLLLTDRYPSTDTQTDVRLIIQVPSVDSPRDRRIALIKPILVLPHVLLWLVSMAFAYWATMFAWFAGLLGMRLPMLHRDTVLAALRYGLVIYGYAFLHLTDRYPRFRDGPEPPR